MWTILKIHTITFTILTIEKTILETCDIWDTGYKSDNWEPEFVTIFFTWQLIVTLDSIRNSCDVSPDRFWYPYIKFTTTTGGGGRRGGGGRYWGRTRWWRGGRGKCLGLGKMSLHYKLSDWIHFKHAMKLQSIRFCPDMINLVEMNTLYMLWFFYLKQDYA